MSFGEHGALGTRKRSPESESSYKKLQNELISTPGHAKALMNHIYKVREYLEEHPAGGKEYDSRELGWAFRGFSFLPSVETIEEMLVLLDDIRPWSEAERYRLTRLGTRAARTLINLLEDPPSEHILSDRELWLKWREEIRSGASFKFKDLEGRYTLKGKVVPLPRRVHQTAGGANPKSMLEKQGGIESNGEAGTRVSASLYSLVLLFLGGSVFYLWWSRQKRS